jgi:hypothetical protein
VQPSLGPLFTQVPASVSRPSQNTLIRCVPTCVEGCLRWDSNPCSLILLPLTFRSVGVCQCASLLSQGSDELAAEVGDVGDHRGSVGRLRHPLLHAADGRWAAAVR